MTTKKYNPFVRTILRFSLVGVAATVTHALAAFVMTYALHWNQILINTAAFLIAFSVSAAGHTFYTFRVSDHRLRAMWRWFVVSVIGLLVGNGLIWAAMALGGQSKWTAQTLAIILVAGVSFVLSRGWAFKPVHPR